MIPVLVDHYSISTICFTCASCDFVFGGTFGYALFLKNSLETFSESPKGTFEDDIEAPTEVPREEFWGHLGEVWGT